MIFMRYFYFRSLYDEVEESLDLEQATYLLKIAETARKQVRPLGHFSVALDILWISRLLSSSFS